MPGDIMHATEETVVLALDHLSQTAPEDTVLTKAVVENTIRNQRIPLDSGPEPKEKGSVYTHMVNISKRGCSAGGWILQRNKRKHGHFSLLKKPDDPSAANSQKKKAKKEGQAMVGNRPKTSREEKKLAFSPDSAEAPVTGKARPQRMKQLHESSVHWLKLLPNELTAMERTSENIKDPLYRFFEREVRLGSRLLSEVRGDLEEIVMVCKGQQKPTNYYRILTNGLNKGILPDQWVKYKIPTGVTFIHWIQDFADRISQLKRVVDAVMKDGPKGLKNVHVWVGGLFNPGAFVTASRQFVAQANAWSLEELILEGDAGESLESLKIDDCCFAVTGLKVMGATCKKGKDLGLVDEIRTEIPMVLLRWKHAPGRKTPTPQTIRLPFYRYPTRENLLFTLDFNITNNMPAILYEREIALISNTQLG